MRSIKQFSFIPVIVSAFLLSSCGGGGGGGAPASTASTAVSYKSVAQVGELISYTLDTTNLSYSYRIEKSAFGLEGRTFTGTLTRNSDGTYTPSESSNARVMILPNGLLIGSITIPVGSGSVSTSIVGMQNPATSIAEFSDTFNYISYQCSGLNTNCVSYIGSVKVNSSGQYQSCTDTNVTGMSDIATDCPANNYSSGRLDSNNDGTWKLMRASGNNFVEAGTFIAFKDSQGQKVAIFDLNDGVNGGYGYGSIVAASQESITSGQVNGVYRANSSDGDYVTVTANNNTYQSYSPKYNFTETGSLAYDDPWTGVIRAAASNNQNYTHDVIMAGSGVYISRNRNTGDRIEVGIIDR